MHCRGFELDIITTFLYVKTNKKGWLSIRIDGALMLYNFNRHPPLGFNASAVENKNVHFFQKCNFSRSISTIKYLTKCFDFTCI